MTDETGITSLIDKLKKTLENWRRRTQGISTDSNVLHWKKVNIESFTSVIEDLDLSPIDLRRARDNYPGLAQDILHRITLLSNELHNLESDIKLGPLAPEIAKAAAEKIEGQCKELKPDVERLVTYHEKLTEGSKALKENLNFSSFIPQARQLATSKQKSLFETGYTIYLTVADDLNVEHDEDIVNIFTYLGKITKLQEAISSTDIPPLPGMASSFLEHQLNICRNSCDQVRFFINFVSEYFQSEMEHIREFQKNLEQLKLQTLTELLLEIPSQTEEVSRCIQRFTHKKFLMEDIQKASRLLSDIDQFLRVLSGEFIDYLQTQTDKKNGLLNPETLAIARSRKYFSGIKGLWRFTRMLLYAVGAQSLISQDDLQEKIAEAITTCSFFFEPKNPESHNMDLFADSFFSTYKRPFPHDELADTTKKCIMTYATILEKVFNKYKSREQTDDGEQQKLTLGRLSGKIEIRTENLRKYREKYEQ